MRKHNILLIAVLMLGGITVQAQEKSLAQSLNMFVFPGQDQTSEQQSTDEYECYKWAMSETGYDPMNPTQVEAEQVETGPDGSAIRGAAGGAAAGAAIGAIAGDAGKGAAIGAVAGGLRGRRARAAGQAQQQQQANATAEQQSQALEDNFKKAFSVCLEAKGYSVK